MAKLIERYADALLSLADESSELDHLLNEAVLIRDTLNNSEVEAFLVHPHISDSEKYQLFEKTFPSGFDKHLIGFLYLAVEKNREALIVPVLSEYIDRLNKKLGRTKARVVSAQALTEAQITSLQAELEQNLKKQIEIEAVVDPDVIGGFYILVDGRVFDGTVRSRLNMLKERLKRGRYECK